jgi:hypothetical protein
MDRARHVIRFSGQEREELMLAGLALMLSSPQAPDSGESENRPTFVEREPMRHLPTVGPFAKGRCRNETTPFRLEPTAPVG